MEVGNLRRRAEPGRPTEVCGPAICTKTHQRQETTRANCSAMLRAKERALANRPPPSDYLAS